MSGPRIQASLLLGLALASAAAAAPEDTLRAGVEAYTNGLHSEERARRVAAFRRAEQLFARLTEDVVNPLLYTNLGNAALQAERLGPAVLAYRRALRLDPDQPRALQNLTHARTLLPDWVPRPEPTGLLDTFFFWQRALAAPDRALAAAVCFALAAVLVALSLRTRQSVWRNVALLPLLAFAALQGSVWLDPARDERDEAVVTADETVARAADSALAPSTLPEPLPGGAEVRVLETRSPWVRVRLANGRDAWIAETDVTRVTPRTLAAGG